MCLVLNWSWTWPLMRIVVSRLVGSRSVAIQGPIGLKVSEFFAPPQGAVLELPGALADIVADGTTQDTAQGILWRAVLGLLADHGHQFPLYLELVRRIFG